MHSVLRDAIFAAAVFAGAVRGLNPIKVEGQDFVDSETGKRFEILGIDYQLGGEQAYQPGKDDPLSNAKNCLRDAALMQRLGVNTIRTYNVDPKLNHDKCASIFNAAGIYMIVDVNSPLGGESIEREKPKDSYNLDYVKRIFGVVENFRHYPNTLGFFGANELVNSDANGKSGPPYIRAVQRDLKRYLKAQGGRKIPVGYSAADVADIRVSQIEYLTCAIPGEQDAISRSDFFGINSYSWCGKASFKEAGYDVLVRDFGQSTIPVFFSEYGCNEVQPRIFEEVGTLYGEQMTVFSGGLVYEWTQEENNYGIVKITKDGGAKLLGDYHALQKQYNDLDLKLIMSRNETASNLKPPKCSSKLIDKATFSKDWDLPEAPKGTDELIKNGYGKAGKIVSVTEAKVPQKIVDTDGSEIKGLELKPVKGSSNTPDGTSLEGSGSGNNRGGGSGTSTGASGAASSSGAAVPGLGVVGAKMAWGALAGSFAFVLGL
ncbi:MAG: hypothetical protein M1831_003506 [Alyxoria varia]|nr:MAG: hypothetical protein M1831_003506 [Alyxoria varia]